MTDPADRLTAIKARHELLRSWHETFDDVAEGVPRQRCRRCGAESDDFPETEILHDEGCPVPAAIHARRDDEHWLIGEVDRLRVRVAYRDRTLEELKAEVERWTVGYQRVAADAEEVERLRAELDDRRRAEQAATIADLPSSADLDARDRREGR